MGKYEVLENLPKIIEQDPSYFAKAKTDKNLTKTEGVNELLDKIKQEAKTKAEIVINDVKNIFINTEEIKAHAEREFKKLRDSSVSKAKSSFRYENWKNEHKLAEKLLEDAIIKVESGKYEEIVNAKSVAEKSKTTLIESHKSLDLAVGIAIYEEKQTIDGETRENAAEVERLRLKKIQGEEAIVAAKAAVKAAEAEQMRKVKYYINASPAIIFGFLSRVIVHGFFGYIGGALIGIIILTLFGFSDSKPLLFFFILPAFF